jgi:AraC-like DNA-binding protein
MGFHRMTPSGPLQSMVECYWMIRDTGTIPFEQKIIPDGFPEIIFHLADPFMINMGDGWKLQETSLFAGQLSRHFYLRNTGTTNVIGIKMKPAAPRHLFGLNMSAYNDLVVPLASIQSRSLESIDLPIKISEDPEAFSLFLDELLTPVVANAGIEDVVVDNAVNFIIEKRGVVTVRMLTEEFRISERHLQRLFKLYVGISPKLFARIIRFSAIFRLKEDGDADWLKLAMESGYYDQSHFIKNFQAFTGEDPGRYDFEETSMANFFLKKDGQSRPIRSKR